MNRPSMLANLDRILKSVKAEREGAAAGQDDLFGGKPSDDLTPIELPDWPLATKLWYERKTLGLFMSGHPVDAFEPKFKAKMTHTCLELRDIPESDWPRMQPIVVCGLVTKVYERSFGANVTLADRHGSGEVQFYRDDYERARWVLRKDLIIAIKCDVRRDGSWSGVVGRKAHKVGEFNQPVD